jgi:two-component system cell cycle sensor histidine kinase/response regulator CckA
VLSPGLIIQAVSGAYLAATMTQRADIVGRHLFQVFPDNPLDPQATGVGNLRASLSRVISSGLPDTMAVQKYDIPRRGGSDAGFEERHWSPVNVPVFGRDGRLAHIIHRVEDVTEYVELEAAIKRGSATTAELTAKTRAMEAEILRRAQEIQLANRELRALHDRLERRVTERTEELRRSNSALVLEVAAKHAATSELARMQAQLLQMQRLDAIGKLAGGIAHDFNNLLTVILGFAAMAQARSPADSDVAADLDQIRTAGERAAQLTRQLLTFSRTEMREVTSVDLDDVVTSMREMLARLVGEAIDLTTDCGSGVRPIEANRSQIEQVVMNLVVNARDAMPRGGRLRIETANIDLDAAYAATHLGVEPGAYAMLSVTDTGCGMDEYTQSRIFEPFFTTKDPGKGTGLGLSTVFGIVKQSRGHVWVYSEVGVGTTMKVFLPHREAKATAVAPALPARVAARSGESLLLVEDDDQVRLVASRILKDVGYRLYEAKGPEAALEIVRDPGVVLDGLVTDVVMPRMGGRQLAESVQAIRPGIGVLFMSGYSDDIVLQSGVSASQFAFVEKPLMAPALTSKVREVLDRRRDTRA